MNVVVVTISLFGFVVGVSFFFQAEDGIRDLVRSRGLGDVYKRQVLEGCGHDRTSRMVARDLRFTARPSRRPSFGSVPVSYTHLTLPTSDLV